jgi:ubiquinone biosynthesis protein
MRPFLITRSVRSLNRLRQIAQVLTQHGFGYIVDQIDLSRFVPGWQFRKKKGELPIEGASALGRRLRRVFSDLGPTFVKLGQMLTTRPDIIPQAVIDELRFLQDEVPPFETAAARQIIKEQLGQSVEEAFARFDETPIASGSIGQVYRARTHTGANVMVKVRRPGIEHVIELDMQLLKWLAESLENLMPEVRVYRPMAIVQEFEQTLAREMDFINEASATSRLADAFGAEPYFRIPHVFWELTSGRVLTLEVIPGRNIEHRLAEERAGTIALDHHSIAQCLLESFLRQVFDIGVFHGDPHPGNILVEPPATVGLIDFGQIGTISDETMTQIVVLVYAAVGKELDVIVDTLADMGALGATTDRRELQRSLRVLLDKYYGLPLKRFELGTILDEFAAVIRRHDVLVPREVILLIKALGMITGVATELDPNLDVLELLRPRLKKTLSDRVAPPRLLRSAAVTAWQVFSALRRAPGTLREVLHRLATGTWDIRIRHENIDRLSQEIDRSSNRLAFAMVIAAIIVGSSIVVSADSEMELFGLTVQSYGLFGYLMAAILGLALLWAIYRSGRLH